LTVVSTVEYAGGKRCLRACIAATHLVFMCSF